MKTLLKKQIYKVSLFVFPGLVLLLIYTNCSSRILSTSDIKIGGESTFDAWNAPVGELVQGANLFDGWEDLRLLPEPVNVLGGWTDSAAISDNGLNLYFTYTPNSFSDIVDGIGFNVTGPLRAGMTSAAMKNFRAELTSAGWVVNFMPTPFNTDPNLWETSLSANANENLIVWTTWDSSLTRATMWYSYKNTDGTWVAGQQVPAPIQSSTNCSNDNPFVVGDITTGVDLYWESNRTDLSCSASGDRRHIYHSFFNPNTGLFSSPELVPGLNGSAANDEDQQPFFTKDKKHAYWTIVRANDYAVYTADLVGTAYMNARPVLRPNLVAPFTGKLTFAGEANIAETPQGWVMYLICGIATKESGTAHGAQLKICRMRKPKTTNTEAAKKINSAGWSDSPYISRDGKRLYFMYSRWDFSPWIKSGGIDSPVLAGPDRPGLRKNSTNPFDESDIYVSTKNDDGAWSEPVNLGLNGNYGDSSGMEYNNGNSFIWLHGDGSHNYIVQSTKNSDGTWGAITELTNVNSSTSIQDNPYISDDGNYLWFVSSRSGGSGGKDFWFSSKSGGAWSNPVNLGSIFNSSGDDDQPWIPNGGASADIYWNSPSGLKHCVSNGSSCTATPEIINIPGCPYAAEVSMPDTQDIMYFGCGNATTGRVQIMYSKKQSNGSWGTATPVD